MLSCLGSYSFDNQRDSYVYSIAPYVKSVKGSELASALGEYSFDEGRMNLVKAIGKHVTSMTTSELINCLEAYSFDTGRDALIETIAGKVRINPIDYGKINECFSFGSKNLGKLLSAEKVQRNDGIKVTIEYKHEPERKNTKNIITFLDSLGDLSDTLKYMAIEKALVDLMVSDTDLPNIAKHFRDAVMMANVYKLLKVSEQTYKPHIDNRVKQFEKIYINGEAISYEGKMFYVTPYGNLKLSGPAHSCNIVFTQKNGEISTIEEVDLVGMSINVTEGSLTLNSCYVR